MDAPQQWLSSIGATVAPVVLISATAIFLSNHTTRYHNISSEMRALAAEYRGAAISDLRRDHVRRQLELFARRLRLLWLAGLSVHGALTCFVITVLAVALLARSATAAQGASVGHLGRVGTGSLMTGLLLLLISVVLEVGESFLASRTSGEELSDILAPNQMPAPVQPESDDGKT